MKTKLLAEDYTIFIVAALAVTLLIWILST